MNRIKILPDAVKKKIAAGEVVEGPFSVVKELVENSIDAGATEIAVLVEDSGLKKIMVTDNGCGIHYDDIELAVAEHATSKISDIYDIETIRSYGFRGEALASISSISRLTILSRREDEEIGARFECEDDHREITEYYGPRGTTVIVENLFYNTPARKKFLKTKNAEMRLVRDAILSIALAHPGVFFTIEIEKKSDVVIPAVSSLMERMQQVYGSDIIDYVQYERLQDLKISIEGFLSKPEYMKPSRSMQHLYINKRPVEFKYLGFILSKAYEAVAQKGQHPAAVIFIEIAPDLVDVNIHPAKREVKLFDQRYVEGIIYHLAGKVLNRPHAIDGALFTGALEHGSGSRAGARGLSIEAALPGLPGGGGFQIGEGSLFSPPGVAVHGTRGQGDRSFLQQSYADSSETRELMKDGAAIYHGLQGEPDVKLIGLVFGTYVVFELGGVLYFIDFHAAHERQIFDVLISAGHAYEKQELMFPRVIELSIADHRTVVENIHHFNEIGFDIDEFSDNSIAIRAVPEIASRIDADAVFQEIIESLKEEKSGIGDIKKNIAATVACHSARRANDRLSRDEMEKLVQYVTSGKGELRCPHGRPFMFTIGKTDLERLFKRS